MKFVKITLWKLILGIFLFLTPLFILFAQTHVKICNPADGKLCNPIESDTLDKFLQVFLEGVLKLGIPLIALAIIYSGFLFVAARGNSEKLGKAKDALLYTLIGAAILMGSWALATLISATVRAL